MNKNKKWWRLSDAISHEGKQEEKKRNHQNERDINVGVEIE